MEECNDCGKEGACEIERIDKTEITVCVDCIENYGNCELCKRAGRLDELEMEYLHAGDNNPTCHFCIGIIARNLRIFSQHAVKWQPSNAV